MRPCPSYHAHPLGCSSPPQVRTPPHTLPPSLQCLPASSSAPKYKFVVPNEFVTKFMTDLIEKQFRMVDGQGGSWDMTLIQRKNKEKYEYMLQGWRRYGEEVNVRRRWIGVGVCGSDLDGLYGVASHTSPLSPTARPSPYHPLRPAPPSLLQPPTHTLPLDEIDHPPCPADPGGRHRRV